MQKFVDKRSNALTITAASAHDLILVVDRVEVRCRQVSRAGTASPDRAFPWLPSHQFGALSQRFLLLGVSLSYPVVSEQGTRRCTGAANELKSDLDAQPRE